MYRISRATDRGPYANRDCFVAWLTEKTASGDVSFVDAKPEPGNTGGANDHTLILWEQVKAIPTPTCFPGLQTANGANGWASIGEARVIFDAMLAGANVVAKAVDAANAKATSPENIAKSAAYDAEKAVGAVGQAAKESAKGFLAGFSALQLASAAGAAALAFVGWKKFAGRR